MIVLSYPLCFIRFIGGIFSFQRERENIECSIFFFFFFVAGVWKTFIHIVRGKHRKLPGLANGTR